MKSTPAKNRLKRGLAAVAAGFALLAGPVGAQEPIKIGAFLSVTGGAAFLGDPEQKTLELYVDKINAAGGVLGRTGAAIVSVGALSLPGTRAPTRRSRLRCIMSALPIQYSSLLFGADAGAAAASPSVPTGPPLRK